MAEAWRLEEDEEELRELGRRHRRGALGSAAGEGPGARGGEAAGARGGGGRAKGTVRGPGATTGGPGVTVWSVEPILTSMGVWGGKAGTKDPVTPQRTMTWDQPGWWDWVFSVGLGHISSAAGAFHPSQLGWS